MRRINIILLLFLTAIGYGQTQLSDELKRELSKAGYQIDLDNDGENEIITFQGTDLSYLTLIYSHEMIEIHRNYTAYSVVLDIDKDGIPELLEPIFPKEFLKELDCEDCEKYRNMSMGDYYEEVAFSFFDKPSYNKIAEEGKPIYLELSKGYNSMIRFNSFSSLSILTPIRILQYENGAFIDKTAQYSEHLEWRIGLLKRLKKIALEGKEKNAINGIIRYLQTVLD